jgi:hypothetical protein
MRASVCLKPEESTARVITRVLKRLESGDSNCRIEGQARGE